MICTIQSVLALQDAASQLRKGADRASDPSRRAMLLGIAEFFDGCCNMNSRTVTLSAEGND